jgi:hypothetical protein
MTGSAGGTPPPSERSHRGSIQNRGSTVSMASTATGLPDRYRPLDQVGPDEPTPTGVIRCWRAKDRVLNRDVAIRVHTPAGPAAHAWITRALTAGGLATPALAMVYDASEGSGDPQAPGGAAYVVNEWIDGETLSERLTRGPLPDREVRTVLRRLAEGVAEAHRVGLAVGGLTPENVVLRPNGLVGLRAVPAATGSIDGDIAALGALLEICLTGLGAGQQELAGAPDLVALVRRARSSEPGQGLSSVAAMAALLAERPRSGPAAGGPSHKTADETDSGWLRRLRERRPEQDEAQAAQPVRLDPGALPPVRAVRPVSQSDTALSSAALGGDTIDASFVAPAAGAYAGMPAAFPAAGPDTWSGVLDGEEPADGDDDGARRHRLLVFGLPLVALIVVIALAWWVGSTLLDVTDSVDDVEGSTPSVSTSAGGSAGSSAPAGAAVTVAGADVFDPGGDGQPENDQDVPLALDDDPATAWSTLTYQGSPAFGNLKDGVGLLLDLGRPQAVGSVTLTTDTPDAEVEIRTGDEAGTSLDDFDAGPAGTLEASTDLAFDKPVTARYVLVWITGLVPTSDGFSADLSGITVNAAG